MTRRLLKAAFASWARYGVKAVERLGRDAAAARRRALDRIRGLVVP